MNLTMQNISVRMPQTDVGLFNELASKMGWSVIVLSKESSDEKKDDFDMAMQRLSGCIKLPKDFNYKKELEEILTAKYL